MPRRSGLALLLVANVLCWCVLSFYQGSVAAPPSGNQPFANSVEQRQDMLTQLKEINSQLKDLNAYLRSGNLKVTLQKSDRR